MLPKDELMQERYDRYREKIKSLTLMSDILSRNVLKDRRCTEYILRIIMDDKKLRVVDQRIQADYKNLHGRSAILDCVVVDGQGRVINIELQQGDEGASPKRARYHQALMDTNILNSSEIFDALPESYVIFITRNDALKKKRAILHVTRVIEETGEEFGDETHFIYVDSSKQENTELGRLMHDLNCTNAGDMQKSVLSDTVKVFKESERGIEYMSNEIDEIRNEGKIEAKMETAENLFKMGMPVEKIASAIEMDQKTVEKWLEEKEIFIV